MGDMKYIFEIDQIENLYMLSNASTLLLKYQIWDIFQDILGISI